MEDRGGGLGREDKKEDGSIEVVWASKFRPGI